MAVVVHNGGPDGAQDGGPAVLAGIGAAPPKQHGAATLSPAVSVGILIERPANAGSIRGHSSGWVEMCARACVCVYE